MCYEFKIIVTGDFACFTRPEMKVERVSYDVPTPSALCGMLKSIYWKPAIRYVIDEIIVFNPINFMNVLRNEIKDKVSFLNLKSQMEGKATSPVIYADEKRSQRSSMILKDVKYGVKFKFETTGIKNENETDSKKKHYSIIKRRLEKGQQFRTPCLGCSEFPVKSIKLVEKFNEDEIDKSISERGDIDLGDMLYELKFEDKLTNKNWDCSVFSDKANAVYYHPHMEKGVINVKKYKPNEERRS